MKFFRKCLTQRNQWILFLFYHVITFNHSQTVGCLEEVVGFITHNILFFTAVCYLEIVEKALFSSQAIGNLGHPSQSPAF